MNCYRDLDQWGEDHGEGIGFCSRHRAQVLGTCDLCDDEWEDEEPIANHQYAGILLQRETD